MKRLIWLESTASTNDVAKELVRAGKKDVIVAAGQQTAGRGRQGRSFYSPPNMGIYLSMALPYDGKRSLPPTVIAGAAAASVLSTACGRQIGCKWVNDLLLDGYKIGGILSELCQDRVIVGIGVNVNQTQEDIPPELSHVSSLAARCGRMFRVEALRYALIREMDIRWQPEMDEETFAYYRKHLLTLGQRVKVMGTGSERWGTAVGLAKDSALLVCFDDTSAVERVIGPEVSIRGPHGYL